MSRKFLGKRDEFSVTGRTWTSYEGRSKSFVTRYDLLTLKMTSDAIENDTIELAVLKNPNIDTEIIPLALLKVTLAQDSSYSFRLKLQTPKSRSSSPSLKESKMEMHLTATECHLPYGISHHAVLPATQHK